jgi:uncharacterized protein
MKKTKCPTCRRESIKDGNKLWPFCSERCHLVDLGRWLDEEYRVPDEPDASGGGVESVTPQTKDEN